MLMLHGIRPAGGVKGHHGHAAALGFDGGLGQVSIREGATITSAAE